MSDTPGELSTTVRKDEGEIFSWKRTQTTSAGMGGDEIGRFTHLLEGSF